MNFIIDLLLEAALLFILATILPGIKIKNYTTAIFVCLVVGVLNATIGLLIRLPLDIITLGLLTFIVRLFVTGIMIKFAGNLFKGFLVKNWFYAFLLALCLAIGAMLFQQIGL
ncbi:MAG TPA: phage holin family protein [Hanamia sp.]